MGKIFYFLWFAFFYLLGQFCHLVWRFRFKRVTPLEYYLNAWKEHFYNGHISPSPREVIMDPFFLDYNWDLEDRWKYQHTKPSRFERWLVQWSLGEIAEYREDWHGYVRKS